MPNWATNHVHVQGTPEQIQALTDAMIRKVDGETVFDFNGVLPMPEELKGAASPLEVVATQEEADAINAKWCSNWPSPEPPTGTVRAITQAENDRRKAAHGAIDWYDWAVANWGTKWNAGAAKVEAETGTIKLVFDTAWCAPIPVFEAMGKHFGVEVNAMTLVEGFEEFTTYGDRTYEHFYITVEFS